jgi:hypothetical protein
MKKITTKVVSILLASIMTIAVMPNLAGCGNDNEEGATDSGYSGYAFYEWNESSTYIGSLSFSSDVTATFKDISTSDFTLVATKSQVADNAVADEDGYYETEVVSSVTLSDFTISKTADKTLSYEFTTPITTDLDYMYTFQSKSAVTSDDQYVSISVLITHPKYDFFTNVTGAYGGSKELSVELSFMSSGKFVENLQPSMFELPYGFDGGVSVTRTDDTTATLTISDIPDNLSSACITINVLASAINSPFSTDTTVHINLVDTELTVDANSIDVDNEEKTITFGKIYLSDDVTGITNGICCMDEENYELVASSYDKKENYYSATVKLKNFQGAISEDELYDIEFIAVLYNGDESISKSFYPANCEISLKNEVEIDSDNNKVTITVSAVNGLFKENITADDFTITGIEGLTNFKLESADLDKVVFTANYPADTEISQFVEFTISSDKMDGKFNGEYSAIAYIGVFDEDRTYDTLDFAKDIGSGMLGAIGRSVAEAILPYLLDFLGVDRADSDETQIKNQISAVSAQIQGLSDQINSVTKLIKTQGYVSTLTTYQTKETRLLTKVNNLVSNTDVTNFIAAYTKNTHKNIKRQLEGFYDFYDIFYKYGIFKIDKSNLTESQLKTFIGYYNKFKSAFEQYSYRKDEYLQDPYRTVCSIAFGYDDTDLINISELKELSYSWMMCKIHNITLDTADGYGSQYKSVLYFIADVEKAYDIRSEYGEISLNPTAIENNSYTPEYISAVDKLGGTTFVADVMEVGSLLLSSGAGTEAGVLENFFSVVNSIYNFESQTIEIKKSFLAKAEYIYDVAAGFAYNYSLATGDTANATTVKEQLSSVNNLFNKMWNLISEAEKRAAVGTDIILITNQKISKTMLAYDVAEVNKTSNSIGSDALSISMLDLTEMATRAGNRGVSLAQDLRNAGFTNIAVANYSTATTDAQYVFITGATMFKSWDMGNVTSLFKELGTSGWVEIATRTMVTGVLEQTGLETKTSEAGELCAYHLYQKMWSLPTEDKKSNWTHNYYYVLAFNPA